MTSDTEAEPSCDSERRIVDERVALVVGDYREHAEVDSDTKRKTTPETVGETNVGPLGDEPVGLGPVSDSDLPDYDISNLDDGVVIDMKLGRPKVPKVETSDIPIQYSLTSSRQTMVVHEPDGLSPTFLSSICVLENRTVLIFCYLILLCVYACLKVGGSFRRFGQSSVFATQPRSQDITKFLEGAISFSLLASFVSPLSGPWDLYHTPHQSDLYFILTSLLLISVLWYTQGKVAMFPKEHLQVNSKHPGRETPQQTGCPIVWIGLAAAALVYGTSGGTLDWAQDSPPDERGWYPGNRTLLTITISWITGCCWHCGPTPTVSIRQTSSIY